MSVDSVQKAPPTARVEAAARTAHTADTTENIARKSLDDADRQWFQERLVLSGYNTERHWNDAHSAVASEFLAAPTAVCLLCFMQRLVPEQARQSTMDAGDPGVFLILTYEAAQVGADVAEVVYFVKPRSLCSAIELVHGHLVGDWVDSLHRLMRDMFVPLFLKHAVWPEGFRRDLAGHTHKFMGSLTDTVNHLHGTTVLYVPEEPMLARSDYDAFALAKDKELTQRLESTLIQWTRQIKDVLASQDTRPSGDDAGPITELDFWSARDQNLTGLRSQLRHTAVVRIVDVLTAARSSYLEAFLTLRRSIEQGSEDAQQNLRFLAPLREPCEALASSSMDKIPSTLDALLSRVRMISAVSMYYGAPERATILLRRVSNALLSRCARSVSIASVVDPAHETSSAVGALQQCIATAEAWRVLYKRAERRVTERYPSQWRFTESTIFAQVDAFVQRCRDLLDVCSAKRQFVRSVREADAALGSEQSHAPAPTNAMPWSAKVDAALEEIEKGFCRALAPLAQVSYDIMDAGVAQWHDDFAAFKQHVKDLELSAQNVVNSAMDAGRSVFVASDLLEGFFHFAERETVQRCVEKRVPDVVALFRREVSDVRHEFDARRAEPPLGTRLAPASGSAQWALGLIARLERSLNSLTAREYVHAVIEWKDTAAQASALLEGMRDFVDRRFDDWVSGPLAAAAKSGYGLGLNVPLLRRSDDGLLEHAASSAVLLAAAEARAWQALGRSLPEAAYAVMEQSNALRSQLDGVQGLVREYNAIHQSLLGEESSLFSERLGVLDRALAPGLTSLTWVNRSIVDVFVRECRKACRAVAGLIAGFHAARVHITATCERISSTQLVRIRDECVYDEVALAEEMDERADGVQRELRQLYETLLRLLTEQFKLFEDDSPHVLAQWRKYVGSVDAQVGDALRTAVRQTLENVLRRVHADDDDGGRALIRVFAQLDGSGAVVCTPSLASVASVIVGIARRIVELADCVPWLAEDAVWARAEGDSTLDALAGDGSVGKAPLAQSLASATPAANSRALLQRDDGIEQLIRLIAEEVSTAERRGTEFLASWKRYARLWEMDKDAFIRRYARQEFALSAFESDVQSYSTQQQDVQSESSAETICFVQMDCGQLKQSLIAHCVEWRERLTGLLNEQARSELEALHALFRENSARLRLRPDTLEQLAELLDLHRRLYDELADTESRFAPVRERYELLARLDVSVAEAEVHGLAALSDAWAGFLGALTETGEALPGFKEEFHSHVRSSLDTFATQVAEIRRTFLREAPFDGSRSSSAAMDDLARQRRVLVGARAREESLQAGVRIFDLERPEYRELADCERELDQLARIWDMRMEWEEASRAWRTRKFLALAVEDMEGTARKFQRRAMQLPSEVRGWKCWSMLRDEIDVFRRTMPLVAGLRSESLRPRHWERLVAEVGQAFDPTSDDFTLERVLALGLDAHADAIAELTSNAAKELAIEQALEQIEDVWAGLQLDLVEHKAGSLRVQGADAILEPLDDHQVSVATMKSTRYYGAFKSALDEWEDKLSHAMETVEVLLGVQRQWVYLENIFTSSEDIRRQLPGESATFDEVDAAWRRETASMSREANALRALSRPVLLASLQAMDQKLEEIQKALDSYLETKRQAFPRFYFLSNDDLLEVLAQGGKPDAVQPHLKKCFEGITSLQLEASATALGSSGLAASPAGAAAGGAAGALAAVTAAAAAAAAAGAHVRSAHGMLSADGELVPFLQPVKTTGAVEQWLVLVEEAMRATLRKLLGVTARGVNSKKDKWVRERPGQLLITAGQIAWTGETGRALTRLDKGDKNVMRVLRKKQHALISKLTEMVRSPLSATDRRKLVALITIEVHSRDVIDRLIRRKVASADDFEWLSQLRLSFDRDSADGEGCIVQQARSTFAYGYEYLGNSGRLVVTPLTDRCYLTLTSALQLHRGGNPQGPAGTGKTETVKDLGKAVAQCVIVFNCSDGLDFRSVGRMLSGLAQTGAWSCFDEFNRIDVEVLSVVAQQISTIFTALAARVDDFVFEGQAIQLRSSVGIFVTMNPGYAGRSELPDNLKALFRPISMMVPDLALIAEIMLFSEGFTTAKALARKLVSLYALASQQLSKQDHYDFGLRSLRSVLNAAGAAKRCEGDAPEDGILVRTVRDMNLPKLVAQDMVLFEGLVQDLFPGMEIPAAPAGALEEAVRAELRAAGLQEEEHVVRKCLQLHECKQTRHGNMLVGGTGAGKSVVWQTLAQAYTRLQKEQQGTFCSVRATVVNPKAVSLGELYGEYNLSTREWKDGILSALMRTVCADTHPDEKWIVFDGPIDTLWIESMNTVLDDNKLLTLVSGERIALPSSVSLLFEVEDLSVASPATVSRAGMVYMDPVHLGWRPLAATWLAGIGDARVAAPLQTLFDAHVDKLLALRRRDLSEVVAVCDVAAVRALCHLLEVALVRAGASAADASGSGGVARSRSASHGVPVHETMRCQLVNVERAYADLEGEALVRALEMEFFYACAWSIGGAATETGRARFDAHMREVEAQLPAAGTIYDYAVDTKKLRWIPWEEKLPSAWRPAPGVPMHSALVPTVDTLRTGSVIRSLVVQGRAVLLAGAVGVGKTAIVKHVLQRLPEKHAIASMSLSARTTSHGVQALVESRVEKRTKNVYAPPGGKKLVLFLDDLNMPHKDEFGSQPPLELLRQWMAYGFWYDSERQAARHVADMQLVAAMGEPGGGRTRISARLQSQFAALNCVFPSESQVRRIFGTLLAFRLAEFDEDAKSVAEPLSTATYELYVSVSRTLLPTPQKSHYIFNLRDVSRVFEGVMRARSEYCDTREAMLSLWAHECMRVFADRMPDDGDRAWFASAVDAALQTHFQTTWARLFDGAPLGSTPLYGDFRDVDDPPYEEVRDEAALRSKLERELEEYNDAGGIPMPLVLFRDAVAHVCRINRVLKLPHGHMLLVGVGGSGRQSLARLAAHVAGMCVFSIELRRQYGVEEFRADLRELYERCGVRNESTVFLLSDRQVLDEAFLEDVNGMLSSGEVAGLFSPEEASAIRESVRDDAVRAGVPERADAVYAYFLERVRANLHIVLCLSPVGGAFRDRCRNFPALVNCATIDWFVPWPQDALEEVARSFLQDSAPSASVPPAASDGETTAPGPSAQPAPASLAPVFGAMHRAACMRAQELLQRARRTVHITPSHYLSLVSGYARIVAERRSAVEGSAAKLRSGLGRLAEAKAQVESLSVELKEKKKVVARSQKECEELLVVIVQERRAVDEQAKQVRADKDRIAAEEAVVQADAGAAQRELDAAIPALERAAEALQSLNKKDMSEVKAYSKPPDLVELVLNGVMAVFGRPQTWAEAKKQLGDANFLSSMRNFDKELLTPALLTKIGKYTRKADFDPETVGKVSRAAAGMCQWVVAMDAYGRIKLTVDPKRARVRHAQAALAKKQSALAAAEAQLSEVAEKVSRLKAQYDTSVATKERLREESEQLEVKLGRAQRLVSGLDSERGRWEGSIATLEAQLASLPGDCALAAGMLAYGGAFTAELRRALVQDDWMPALDRAKVAHSAVFSLVGLLASPPEVREWAEQRLPGDEFSVDGAVIVTRSARWPLLIDPQEQAGRWIRERERSHGLVVLDLLQRDWMRTLENAIQFGSPVLVENVREEVDPALGPVLARSVTRRGTREVLRLGDKEVDVHPDFRLYLATRLSNPCFSPEVSTQVTLVDFCVKERGLEDQLLGLTVMVEEARIEQQKSELVLRVASGKRRLLALEDEILLLLSSSTGSLLDDAKLVDALETSKRTTEDVREQLEVAEQTEKRIDEAREAYRPCAFRASLLFFLLTEMSSIDPMYQFSLDAYMALYRQSLERSPRADDVTERIRALNEYHTYAVYKSTCRGLFERHKLLFSFRMCAKILEGAGKLNMEEYAFFLRGGQVVGGDEQPANPCASWLPVSEWDHLCALDALASFRGITASVERAPGDWRMWYQSAEPEEAPLPGEWDNLNELQRLVVLRCLRPDRVVFALRAYVANNMHPRYVAPPVSGLRDVFESSDAETPIVFVLSAGVDPTGKLRSLAEDVVGADRFRSLALGQGQAPVAMRLLEEGMREGHWVFLANCHLSLSWMPALEQIVAELPSRKPHREFRLWLSSYPHPSFPMTVLQRAVKLTTEPPRGLRANLSILLEKISEHVFESSARPDRYKKLVFSLCFFHAVLLERRKFGTLGWNVPYNFNESDFEVAEELLRTYVDAYEEPPMDALRYLVANATYGGRVTDAWDMRLLSAYMSQYFSTAVLETSNFALSPLSVYTIPDDGPLQSYREYVSALPLVDRPEAFGQHPNADIASQIAETRTLLGTILSLRPDVALSSNRTAAGAAGALGQDEAAARGAEGTAAGRTASPESGEGGTHPRGTGGSAPAGGGREAAVYELAQGILARIPHKLDLDAMRQAKADDPSPLHVVLLQEIERYNVLLGSVRSALEELQKGIRGTVVISADLDAVMSALYAGQVPHVWSSAYPSLKPLGSWVRDLEERIAALSAWATGTYPAVHWLGGYTFPSGFLTAVLQTSARRNGVAIDGLSWEFTVMDISGGASLPTQAPKEGVYVRGMVLEGAAWDAEARALREPRPMELLSPMPIIYFKPVEAKRKQAKGTYVCPVYMYPIRAGTRYVFVLSCPNTDTPQVGQRRRSGMAGR